MPSLEHEAVVAGLNARPVTGTPTLAERRAGYDATLGANPRPGDIDIQAILIEHLDADWVAVPESDGPCTILYLHGGGYIVGSHTAYGEFAGRLARATRSRVCVVDYRLAPEYPFPAALEDAVLAYRWLLNEGIASSDIVIAGDSAGGGLALATLMALRDAGVPLPRCAVTFSPWTDLCGTGATLAPGAVDDPMIQAEAIIDMASHYAGDESANPLVSPLYGEFHGLPPLLIQVGTREVLLDDARRVRDKASAAGVPVTYHEGEGLIHVWPVLAAAAPESAEALDRVARFIEVVIT
jgi:monoterpene epsilon-lactone hydrolase